MADLLIRLLQIASIGKFCNWPSVCLPLICIVMIYIWQVTLMDYCSWQKMKIDCYPAYHCRDLSATDPRVTACSEHMESFNTECAKERQCVTVAASFQKDQETGYVMLPPWYSSVSGGFASERPEATMDPAHHLRGHGPVGSFGWKCSMYATPKGFKKNKARKQINAEKVHQCIVRGCFGLRCITKEVCCPIFIYAF